MNLLDRFFAALGFTGPLQPADRPLWANTRTLNDLADLTAAWLNGHIASQPGYYGPVDVDEDDAPGLTAALIACNRARYLTDNSQAGYVGVGADGRQWVQHAAVTGFANPDSLGWLRAAVDAAGLHMIERPVVTSRRQNTRAGVDVTFRDGRPVTGFGDQLDRGHIENVLYRGCGREAVGEVCAAVQVTVWDPTPGRNGMWRVLHVAAAVRV